jgi:Rrf2 family protein
MAASSRYAVAVHALTLLASSAEPLTSEFIASSVNTNPVVIRRVLSALRAARLVASQGGAKGGWTLLRAPEAITLRDVYRAAGDASPFRFPERAPNPDCPVGSTIQRALGAEFERALQGLEAVLGQSTIADMLRQTAARRTAESKARQRNP